MTRVVKHFSIHAIDDTELRVIADVEAGVISVIQVEEEVIREYRRRIDWPHRWVTLFVMQDLHPLVQQLQQTSSMLPGKADVLANRPVVNVYDLADPARCQIFMNWAVMCKEGYQEDRLAIRGLLAHEHAHPLAEGETTQASREIEISLSMEHRHTLLCDARDGSGEQMECRQWKADRREAIFSIVSQLAHKLCLYASRELFANELTIRNGFSEALLHLNRRNMENARSSLRGREDLQRQFHLGVKQGELTPSMASQLLLLGDLYGYLDLTFEIAPFYRAGQVPAAQELEYMLTDEVFPHLEPEILEVYLSLRERYLTLRTELTPNELLGWCESVLAILTDVFAPKGLTVHFHIQLAEN